MNDSSKHNITKVYCDWCDLVFESRKKFEMHSERHSFGTTCEVCPIDTALLRLTSMLRRKSGYGVRG